VSGQHVLGDSAASGPPPSFGIADGGDEVADLRAAAGFLMISQYRIGGAGDRNGLREGCRLALEPIRERRPSRSMRRRTRQSRQADLAVMLRSRNLDWRAIRDRPQGLPTTLCPALTCSDTGPMIAGTRPRLRARKSKFDLPRRARVLTIFSCADASWLQEFFSRPASQALPETHAGAVVSLRQVAFFGAAANSFKSFGKEEPHEKMQMMASSFRWPPWLQA